LGVPPETVRYDYFGLNHLNFAYNIAVHGRPLSDQDFERVIEAAGGAVDGISMIVLTATVVLPMVQQAGFDLIWFGIFVILLVEIAEVTPPVGFNLFVLQNMTGRDSNLIAKSALPFFAMLVVCIAIITVWPELVTWLPDAVMGEAK
jgi:TRAP-type C4-dicarboxylate transport system permease large subunit